MLKKRKSTWLDNIPRKRRFVKLSDTNALQERRHRLEKDKHWTITVNEQDTIAWIRMISDDDLSQFKVLRIYGIPHNMGVGFSNFLTLLSRGKFEEVSIVPSAVILNALSRHMNRRTPIRIEPTTYNSHFYSYDVFPLGNFIEEVWISRKLIARPSPNSWALSSQNLLQYLNNNTIKKKRPHIPSDRCVYMELFLTLKKRYPGFAYEMFVKIFSYLKHGDRFCVPQCTWKYFD